MHSTETNTLFEAEEPYGLHTANARSIEHALEEANYEQVSVLLSELHPADIAHFIATTHPDNRRLLIDLLRDHFDPEILVAFDHTLKAVVVEMLGTEASAATISMLDTDDAVYVIEDLPPSLQTELLDHIEETTRHAIQEALAYPENSAGRLMQKQFVSVPEYWSVGQTIDYLRQNRNLPDDFYEIFAVDSKHRPVGGLLVSRILRSARSSLVSDLMEKNLKIIPSTLDQEEVSFIFTQYALTSAPVVNKDERLIGIISVDDIVEVIEEEAEEDILRMGGVIRTDIHSAFLQTAKHRFLWLFVNLMTALIASFVIHHFSDTIAHIVLLASLMPIVASMGGNAGTQALTVVTRAIATKEITAINALRVVAKETSVGALNGIGFALLTGIIIYVISGNVHISLVFTAAITINLTVAGLAGASIPLILNRIGLDPAITSGIFLTTITDTIGFLSFLGLATWLLL